MGALSLRFQKKANSKTMAPKKQRRKMDGGRCPCWISVGFFAAWVLEASSSPLVLAFAASGSSSSASALPRFSPRQLSSLAPARAPLARTSSAGKRSSSLGASPRWLPPGSIRPRALSTAVLSQIPRGGGALSSGGISVKEISKFFSASTPHGLFHSALLAVAAAAVALKALPSSNSSGGDGAKSKDEQALSPEAASLERKFLAVFWLLRCADWLQGPYFYEVYASKVLPGSAGLVSLGMVSRLFLTGFASTALFGPAVGRLSDQYGRKRATLAFSVIYSIGALSTKADLLWMLFAGRVFSGIGTSLLFSAPESWLVGAAQESRLEGSLGKIFGTAYAGDAIVAIVAGVLAGQCAARRGPSGPFELSTIFLAAGGILAGFLWKENRAESAGASRISTDKSASGDSGNKPTIRDALQVVVKDPKIWLVGCVQSLFEAAMYIFVLQWPPALSRLVSGVYVGATKTPFGTVFSCFMACCLLGSTVFGRLAQNGRVRTERSTAIMLSVATVAMTAATWTVSTTSTSGSPSALLASLVMSFFAFEACVGVYFPSIGTLRSRYVPDSHRGVIMNLFGIPLNALVVGVFLGISRLGTTGALSIASSALAVAAACAVALDRISSPGPPKA